MWKHNKLDVMRGCAVFLIGFIIPFVLGTIAICDHGSNQNAYFRSGQPDWHFHFFAPMMCVVGVSFMVGLVALLVCFLVASNGSSYRSRM